MSSSPSAPSTSSSRPGPASKKQKGTKRNRNQDEDEEERSPRHIEVTFMGSYQWNIKNYLAAVDYMDRSKAELHSATFYLKNGISFAPGARKHGGDSKSDGCVAFQIRARRCVSGDLCLKLFCGWGQPDNTNTNARRDSSSSIEVNLDMDEENEDYLHARYSFSVETPRGPPLRESSGTFQETMYRREITPESRNSFSELRPLANRFRCMNARMPGVGQDLLVNIDYKVVLHKWEGHGGRGDKCRRMAMLDRLHDTKDYADVTLVAAGGQRFPAHRLMLSARSSVFATMFSHPEMVENKTNEVIMDDARPEVIRRILQFIYKDQFQVTAHSNLFVLF